jgi:hypothetical protein
MKISPSPMNRAFPTFEDVVNQMAMDVRAGLLVEPDTKRARAWITSHSGMESAAPWCPKLIDSLDADVLRVRVPPATAGVSTSAVSTTLQAWQPTA